MTDCTRLDDYLDGRLSDADAQAFETHTLSCDACETALDATALDLSPLGDATCPPAVVDAALRAARRAPDRGAARPSGRRRSAFAGLALAAVLAVAIGVGLDRDGPTPEIAEVTPPAAADAALETATSDASTPDVVPDAITDELPQPETADASAPTPTPPASAARPAPRAAQPRAAQPRAVRPLSSPAPARAAPEAAPAPDLAQASPDQTEPGETEPTSAEIAAARQEIALAFRLVADAQTRAGDVVRAEAGPLSTTLDHTLPF